MSCSVVLMYGISTAQWGPYLTGTRNSSPRTKPVEQQPTQSRIFLSRPRRSGTLRPAFDGQPSRRVEQRCHIESSCRHQAHPHIIRTVLEPSVGRSRTKAKTRTRMRCMARMVDRDSRRVLYMRSPVPSWRSPRLCPRGPWTEHRRRRTRLLAAPTPGCSRAHLGCRASMTPLSKLEASTCAGCHRAQDPSTLRGRASPSPSRVRRFAFVDMRGRRLRSPSPSLATRTPPGEARASARAPAVPTCRIWARVPPHSPTSRISRRCVCLARSLGWVLSLVACCSVPGLRGLCSMFCVLRPVVGSAPRVLCYRPVALARCLFLPNTATVALAAGPATSPSAPLVSLPPLDRICRRS
ncbi:hypothetical protein C8Q73DRAFT_259147 [Cubamyces lactineus]|nr:hypothetical protein C8Q73DRAFT_259147 [Cubamyces lactineus]